MVCKDKRSCWDLIGFPNGRNIGEKLTVILYSHYINAHSSKPSQRHQPVHAERS